MANSALPLSQVANIACSAGMDMGFNAAEVESWIDPETFARRIAIRFGDQKLLRRPRLRTPSEWALAYNEEVPCIRESRLIEIPEAALYEASYDLEQRFIAELLELAG